MPAWSRDTYEPVGRISAIPAKIRDDGSHVINIRLRQSINHRFSRDASVPRSVQTVFTNNSGNRESPRHAWSLYDNVDIAYVPLNTY
jgi:hypothetical protein